MPITHSWNGTILTITSDAGTTSADLKGDTGCRGPQGPAGIIYDADGNIVMEGYATEQYVEDLVNNIDMDGYATEIYVDAAIQNATFEGVDLTGFATEDYVDTAIDNALSNFTPGTSGGSATVAVDGKTIRQNADGTISTVIGGYINSVEPLLKTVGPKEAGNLMILTTTTANGSYSFGKYSSLTFQLIYENGNIDTITGTIPSDFWITLNENKTSATAYLTVSSKNATYLKTVFLQRLFSKSTGNESLMISPTMETTEAVYLVVNEFNMVEGNVAASSPVPIGAAFVPVDNETIIINEAGKLTALTADGVDMTNYATKEYVDLQLQNQGAAASKITYGTSDLTDGVSSLAKGTLYCVI